MNIGICDEKPLVCEQITQVIERCKEDKLLELEPIQFCSGDKLLQFKDDIYLVFLSVDVGNNDGYKIANLFLKKKPNVLIVFLAEDTKDIQKAFELGAFRFLRKPISKKEIYSCLNDALEKAIDDYTIVYNDKSKEVTRFNNIQYIEAGIKGTIVRCANDTYCSKNTMIKWEDALVNQSFCRCHKSYIVNLKCVDKICREYAVLHSGERVLISRRRQKEFEHRLKKFISD